MNDTYKLIEQYVDAGNYRLAAIESWYLSREPSLSDLEKEGWKDKARHYALMDGYPEALVDEAIEKNVLQFVLANHSSDYYIIVSRHAGAIEWLRQRGYTSCKVIDHVEDVSQIDGRIVIGNIPLSIAAAAIEVWSIDLPYLRPDQRGKDLSPVEMDEAGAVIHRYKVLDCGEI